MKNPFSVRIPRRAAFFIVVVLVVAVSAVLFLYARMFYEENPVGFDCGDQVPGKVTIFFSDETSIDEAREFVRKEFMEKRGSTEEDLRGEVIVGESDFERLFDPLRRSEIGFTVAEFPGGRQELGRLMVERRDTLTEDERVEELYYSDAYLYRGRWSTTRHIYGINLVDSSQVTEESFIRDHPEIFSMPDFLSLNLERELEGAEEREAKNRIDYFMDVSLKDEIDYIEQVLARFKQNTDDIQVRYSEGLFLGPTFIFSLPTNFSRADILQIVGIDTIPNSLQRSKWDLPVEIVDIRRVPVGTEKAFVEELEKFPEIKTAFQPSVVCPIPL